MAGKLMGKLGLFPGSRAIFTSLTGLLVNSTDPFIMEVGMLAGNLRGIRVVSMFPYICTSTLYQNLTRAPSLTASMRTCTTGKTSLKDGRPMGRT